MSGKEAKWSESDCAIGVYLFVARALIKVGYDDLLGIRRGLRVVIQEKWWQKVRWRSRKEAWEHERSRKRVISFQDL